MKKIILLSLFALFLTGLLPNVTHAAPQAQCSGNVFNPIADPACWTSVDTSYWKWCDWTFYRKDYECGPYHHSSLSDCSDDAYCVAEGNCWFHGDVYTNPCEAGEWCDNMGPIPANYWKWIPQISYTCHYYTIDSWGPCDNDTHTQNATISWHTTSGTNCSDQAPTTSRYCCAAPTSDLTINGDTTGPVSVDAEDPLVIDWDFTRTDVGYSCSVEHPYDTLLTSPSHVVSPVGNPEGVENGTETGRADYAGPNAAYEHPYTLNCTHSTEPADACPSTSDTVNVAVSPLPLEVDIIDLPDPAQVVDMVQLTADVRRGVPDMTDPLNPNYTITWTSSPTTVTAGPGDYTDPALKQLTRRFGVVGFYDFTLTATDLWGNTGSHTETLEVIDDREPQ